MCPARHIPPWTVEISNRSYGLLPGFRSRAQWQIQRCILPFIVLLHRHHLLGNFLSCFTSFMLLDICCRLEAIVLSDAPCMTLSDQLLSFLMRVLTDYRGFFWLWFARAHFNLALHFRSPSTFVQSWSNRRIDIVDLGFPHFLDNSVLAVFFPFGLSLDDEFIQFVLFDLRSVNHYLSSFDGALLHRHCFSGYRGLGLLWVGSYGVLFGGCVMRLVSRSFKYWWQPQMHPYFRAFVIFWLY